MKKNHSSAVLRGAYRIIGAIAVLGSVAYGQGTISLYEVSRFNLSATANGTSSTYIGSNPVAVGWNGSKLYVAGLNSSGGTGTNAIIEITNASTQGLVTPTYSATFGSGTSANTRGYTGLAMSGSYLAASFDLGSNSTNAIQMFNATTNSLTWNLSNSGTNTANIGTTRGYAGPDFDPGFNAGGAAAGGGLGWVTQGQGRRFVNNVDTGYALYTTTANSPTGAAQGMIINTNPTSTNWRDIGFNPATGDLYTRVNNNLSATLRTGSNANISLTGTADQSTVIWTAPVAGNNVGTNLGYMSSVAAGSVNTFTGDAIVINDRSLTTAGQTWENVIKVLTPSGTSITPAWTFLTGSAPGTSTALYDFEWDSASQTLAVLDFTNRTASIFTTAVPEPSTYAVVGCAFAAIGLMLRQRKQAA